MSERKTLKRLGIAAVGAVTFLATPAIGVFTAHADAASLDIVSPWLGDSGPQSDGISTGDSDVEPVSTQDDGTNETIHLEAELTQATEDDPDVASVRFRYQESDPVASPEVTISTDSTAPYTAEWDPPATVEVDEEVDLIYQGMASNGTTVLTTSTQTVVYSQNSTVHMTQPAPGGSIGAWDNAGTTDPVALMKGTASGSDVDVEPFALGEDPAVVIRQPGTDAPFYGDDTWAGLAPVGGVGLETFGVIGGTGEGDYSDEDTQANVYLQTLAAADFTVTPATQTEQIDEASETSDEFIVQAEDQNGNPIAGLNVLLTDASGADDDGVLDVTRGAVMPTDVNLGVGGICTDGDPNTFCVLTDENGQVRFTDTHDTDPAPVGELSDDIRVQTDRDRNGAYNGANDVQRDVNYTVYFPEVDALTLTVLPEEEFYSSQEYTAVCDNTMDNNADCDASAQDADDVNYDGDEDTATSPQGGTPLVRVLVEDQNGNRMVDTAITNLVYRVDRTYDNPDAVPPHTNAGDDIPNTACDLTEGPDADTEVGSCTTDEFGYIYLPHWPSFNKDGTDEFHVWQEINGIPGEGAGDLSAPPLTTTFAGQELFWEICEDTHDTFCNIQANTDGNVSYTVRSEIGGVPNAGENLDIVVDNGGDADPDLFTLTQPAGTTFVTTTHVTCVTNAAGECTVTVNRDSGQDPGENFSDEIPPGANDPSDLVATDEDEDSARLTVDFRNYVISIAGSEGRSARLIIPDANLPPGGNGLYIGNPGDVVAKGYRLLDSEGNRLYHVTGTVSLDDGYFVDEPAGCDGINCPDYDDFEFVPEPEDGEQVGAPEPANGTEANSKALDIETNDDGKFHFFTSIQRDTGFDDNGQISVNPEIDGTGGLPGGVGLPNPGAANGESDLDGVTDGPEEANEIGTTFTTDGNIYSVLGVNAGAGEQIEWRYGYHNPAATQPLVVVEDTQDNLSGNTPTAQERRVFVFTRDQFGNLTRPYAELDGGVNASQIILDTNGVGGLVGDDGNFSSNELPVLSSYTDQVFRYGIHIQNNNPPAPDSQFEFQDGTAGNQTVSATWNAHSYSWVVEEDETSGEFTPNVAPSDQEPALSADFNPAADSENDPEELDCDSLVDNPIECDEGETEDIFLAFANLAWYIQTIDPDQGASYTITHTPNGKVHPVGTTVTQRVVARDQHDEPIVGLEVVFFGAGPGQGDCDTDTGCSSPETNGSGTASYTYQGVFEGNTTITGVIFNGSGNEVERIVDKVGFDDTPRLNAPNSMIFGDDITISGDTRSSVPGNPAVVQLQRNPAGPKGWSNNGAPVNAQNNGNFSFERSPKTNGKFRVRVDGIVFSAPEQVDVFVKIHLSAGSPGNDRVHLEANMPDRQQGDLVKFFRVMGDGDRNLLDSDRANASGLAQITHHFNNDQSGKKLTFVARVFPDTRNKNTDSNEEKQTID